MGWSSSYLLSSTHSLTFVLSVLIQSAPDATFRDLMLAVRADEANHRVVNHTFADIDPDANNPFLVKVS